MGPVIAPESNCGMFCAEGTVHVDACLGDSGSAMICKNEATSSFFPMGTISYGMGCGVEGMPGVYTNISYHITWIEHVTK
jgi:secreted trypsin-like serine protease